MSIAGSVLSSKAVPGSGTLIRQVGGEAGIPVSRHPVLKCQGVANTSSFFRCRVRNDQACLILRLPGHFVPPGLDAASCRSSQTRPLPSAEQIIDLGILDWRQTNLHPGGMS